MTDLRALTDLGALGVRRALRAAGAPTDPRDTAAA
jgi:hypothetical protein